MWVLCFWNWKSFIQSAQFVWEEYLEGDKWKKKKKNQKSIKSPTWIWSQERSLICRKTNNVHNSHNNSLKVCVRTRRNRLDSALSPPNLSCTPRLLTCGLMWEAEKTLTLSKLCLSSAQHKHIKGKLSFKHQPHLLRRHGTILPSVGLLSLIFMDTSNVWSGEIVCHKC